MMTNRWMKIAISGILLFVILFFVIANLDKKPILIGFSSQLTGKQAELGVQERNGVELAIELINSNGGISGRQIELLIKDDYGTPEQAIIADSELIQAGVTAIIGHATTAQTLAGLEITDPAKVIMISPTTSTPDLSGIDDYFFRVYPSFKDSAQALAQYIYEEKGITKMSLIYDSDNMAYSKTYCTTFSEKFIELGGDIINEISFSSTLQPDFSEYISDIQNNEVKGLLIVASDIDTALIAQRTHNTDWQVTLFSSAWAQTKTLISNGGQAVEGMILEQSYVLTSEDPSFIEFQERYLNRFGAYPSFGAAFGYEAAMALAEALKMTGGEAEGLKEALAGIEDFNGVVGTFSIDEFGDVERPFYLSIIENGDFTVLEKLTLLNPGVE